MAGPSQAVSRSFEVAVGTMKAITDKLLRQLTHLNEIADLIKADTAELE